MQSAVLSESYPSLAGRLRNAYRLAAGASAAVLKRKTERLTLLGFACSVAVIVALSALILYQAQRMLEVNDWYARSARLSPALEGARAAREIAAIQLHLQYSIAALMLVLLATLSVIYAMVRRNMRAMRRAEDLTASLNLELEARVQERTKELAQRTAQLEDRSQQLESFSYSVSHDLRAPLRAISGFAQILSRRHRASLDEQGRHFLDNIVEASGHMGRLIDDLLSYSRLGRSALVLKPTRLNEVFAEVTRSLAPRAAEIGATLQVAQDLPAVQGDWTLLSQMFTNLLDNALTYRKTDVPTTVTVTWTRADGAVVVSVADNGIGIAAEHFEGIFDVFQRLHSQDEFPGTGIGLAVVKRAADLQNGRVRVASTVGAGSVFHVSLPSAAADAQSQRA